jgi:hypothetical protein
LYFTTISRKAFFVLFKHSALGEGWQRHKVATVRWRLFHLPGKLVRHAGAWVLKIAHENLDLFHRIRARTLAQGPVDFMNGKVIIDVDGSISAKHFKLDTLDATSSTGGKAIMPAGEILTTVQTTSVNANSLIYVTIQGDYAPATRYWVTNQVEGDSFMVQFDRPTTLPVEFSWFIIN